MVLSQKKTQAQTVFVIGHKNPDTDSISAAISYAFLKNSISDSAVRYGAVKAGPVNNETRFVLERFGFSEPPTLDDVSTQISDIDFRHTEGVSSHISLKRAWEIMKELDVVTLPITREDGRLQGLIGNKDIAYSYMDVYDNEALSRARTQYQNIIETINGQLITGNPHGYFTKGKVVAAAGNRETIKNEVEKDDLVIIGDAFERQMASLSKDPSCLIVTGVSEVSDEVKKEAEARDCVLILTIHDLYTVARLINQSIPIRYFMTKGKLITFDLSDTVDEVRETMSKIRHRDFPVLDERSRYVGMFSRRNLLNMPRKKVILVDHNEKTQAVNGIGEAEILEIIDHHKIGSLETLSPIYFRNQPLGCSSTIIKKMYDENDVEIPKNIAGLMLCAILSDTLKFRSPTCTDEDIEAARALAKIAGEDIDILSNEMFEAGSDFSGKSAQEIFSQDFKVFHYGELSFGVSQINAVSKKQIESLRPMLSKYLEKVLEAQRLDMVYMLLTNIMEEASDVLYAGKDSRVILLSAFSIEDDGQDDITLSGVVSRKKQFIPGIMEALKERDEQG
ncbi:MAG: putative manganese-dependent inorganic diphosphatase [Lachnospiraceae bacterium]|nr:putative manganese-dependent inorganic diphosphatase [Lachnospiraceae bacterium]